MSRASAPPYSGPSSLRGSRRFVHDHVAQRLDPRLIRDTDVFLTAAVQHIRTIRGDDSGELGGEACLSHAGFAADEHHTRVARLAASFHARSKRSTSAWRPTNSSDAARRSGCGTGRDAPQENRPRAAGAGASRARASVTGLLPPTGRAPGWVRSRAPRRGGGAVVRTRVTRRPDDRTGTAPA